MDINQLREHLKNNISYVDKYRKFKNFWYSDVQPVAQAAVGTDAEILFVAMDETVILQTGKLLEKFWVKCKQVVRKLLDKRFRTNRLDWYAVYFIVDMIAKVQEDFNKGHNPMLDRLGKPSYYEKFPNQDCDEAKMYKLLAIKLAQSLQILELYDIELPTKRNDGN